MPQGMAPGEEPCVLDVLVHSSEFMEPIIRFTYEEIEARKKLGGDFAVLIVSFFDGRRDSM